MKLSNFQIVEERGSIEIDALGKTWNLHDAYYLGLDHKFEYNERHFIMGNRVELSWQVDPARYSVAGLSLVFHEVYYFDITPRDKEMPVGEDSCLDSVGKVSLEDETSELKRLGYINSAPADADDFHLYFRFHGGQTVRIGSRTAEFTTTI